MAECLDQHRQGVRHNGIIVDDQDAKHEKIAKKQADRPNGPSKASERLPLVNSKANTITTIEVSLSANGRREPLVEGLLSQLSTPEVARLF